MQLPSDNRLSTIFREYHKKLDNLYDENEVDAMFFYLAWYFISQSKMEIRQNWNNTVSESELLKFHYALKDLLKYRPVQYITGETEFAGLKIIVNENVLIPRPETEELAFLIKERIVKLNSAPTGILDLCTGSGCLAIALKKFFPGAIVAGTDISHKAIAVAEKNAALNSLAVQFVNHDLLNESYEKIKKIFQGKIELIVSNPPYISRNETDSMTENVLKFEPEIALFAPGSDPLIFYRKIVLAARSLLVKGGMFCLELNENSSSETKALFDENFKNVEIIPDMQNKPRFLLGFA